MCNTGVSGAAIVLVLFILLIIILGAYIQGGVNMACSNSCNDNNTVNSCPNERNSGSSFVFIIVLYILLAIIIGSFIIY